MVRRPILRSSEPEESSPQPFGEKQETRTIPGTRVEVLARLGPGDEDLLLMREVVEADRVMSLYSHPEPECVFVIKGTLHVFLDGSGWRTLGADEALHVEPGRRHALCNVGGRPVHLLTVSTVRMTRFLAEVASAEPDAVSALVARYGYWQASPAEDAVAQLHCA